MEKLRLDDGLGDGRDLVHEAGVDLTELGEENWMWNFLNDNREQSEDGRQM